MNQDTLKSVLLHSQDLVDSAIRVQKNTFDKLSPNCEYYESVRNRPICCQKDHYGQLCTVDTCPYVHETIEEIGELGHA